MDAEQIKELKEKHKLLERYEQALSVQRGNRTSLLGDSWRSHPFRVEVFVGDGRVKHLELTEGMMDTIHKAMCDCVDRAIKELEKLIESL